MIDSKVIRFGLALLISTAVAGCLGSNSSSVSTGGGSGGTDEAPGSGDDASNTDGGSIDGPGAGIGSDYNAEFDRITGLAPTTDMPVSIQANYAGRMMADVTSSTDVVGELVADLDLGVNWADGQTSNPFSGGASNFQGRLVDGDFEPIAGTLTVDSSLPGTITRQEIGGGNVAGFEIPATQTGAMMVHLTGELTQDQTVDTTIMLGGNFFGPGASAASGAVAGGFSDPEAGSPAIFDGAIGGTYYLEVK